jgi:hypothetical protein
MVQGDKNTCVCVCVCVEEREREKERERVVHIPSIHTLQIRRFL